MNGVNNINFSCPHSYSSHQSNNLLALVLSDDTRSIVKRICGQYTPEDRMGKKLSRARGGDDWNAFRLFPADKYPGVRVECSTKEGAIGPCVLVTYSTGSKT